ncbi:MAG: hypothetical protein QJR13_09760, partial [Bacillota bacterium]|nr:hypothetical protein [Bacillota bacterium]
LFGKLAAAYAMAKMAVEAALNALGKAGNGEVLDYLVVEKTVGSNQKLVRVVCKSPSGRGHLG